MRKEIVTSCLAVTKESCNFKKKKKREEEGKMKEIPFHFLNRIRKHKLKKLGT